MKRILIVAFHKYDENMYPHLKVFIDLLSKKAETQYFLFRERGYSFEHFEKWKNPKKVFFLFKPIVSDIIKFKKRIKLNSFDKIIVVDHFAYAILSHFVPLDKLIFWSHDIISYDKKYFKHNIVQAVLKRNLKLLKNGGKLLIQDNDRKKVLEDTLDFKIPPENIFFMPTFLEDSPLEPVHSLKGDKPVLMQCGGVGAYRCSDGLLKQYQVDNNYNLSFHGFIFDEIKEALKVVKKVPECSEDRIDGNKIYTIVEKCDIGFVGYTDEELNFKYIAKASGQTVEFLKMAKPVISIGKNNMGQFLEENSAGIEVKSFYELDKAVVMIASNYEFYSKNALKCFNENFSHKLYIDKLLGWLDEKNI